MTKTSACFATVPVDEAWRRLVIDRANSDLGKLPTWREHPHGVYYRIGIFNGRLGVVCMQDFDEPDYDQNSFISDKRFDSEAEARLHLSAEIVKAQRVMFAHQRELIFGEVKA